MEDFKPDKNHYVVTRVCSRCLNDYQANSNGRAEKKRVSLCPACFKAEVIEDQEREHKKTKPKFVTATKPWVLVKTPKDCDFRVGLRVSDDELFTLGRANKNWDVGMVFEHKSSHKLYEVQPELELEDNDRN